MTINPAIDKAAKEWPILEELDRAENQYGKEGEESFLGRAVALMDRTQAIHLFHDVTGKLISLVTHHNKEYSYWRSIEKIFFVVILTFALITTISFGGGTALIAIGATALAVSGSLLLLYVTAIRRALNKSASMIAKYDPDMRRFKFAAKRLSNIDPIKTVQGSFKGTCTQWQEAIHQEANINRSESLNNAISHLQQHVHTQMTRSQ